MECRLCLKKSPINNIFELNLRILHFIENMLKIEKDDDLPKFICNTCVTKLKTIEKFIRQCEESDAYLRNNITHPIKQEPELVLSNYDSPIETHEDSKIQLAQLEIQYAVYNEKSQSYNEITGEFLDCSELLLNDDTANDGSHVEEDNIVEKTTNDVIENKKLCENISKSKRLRKSKSKMITYACSFCPAKYKRKDQYDSHVEIHKRDKIYVCKFCHIVFTSQSSRNRHLKKYHDYEINNLKLDIGQSLDDSGSVGKQLITEGKLLDVDGNIVEHEKDDVIEDGEDNTVEDGEDNAVEDGEDNPVEDGEDNPVEDGEDNAVEDGEDNIVGETLLRPPDSSDVLLDSITNGDLGVEDAVGNVTSDIQTHGGSLTCPHCPAKYKNNEQYRWHIKIHNRSTIFTCQFCQIVFGAKTSLRSHLYIYHKNDAKKVKLKRKEHSDKSRFVKKKRGKDNVDHGEEDEDTTNDVAENNAPNENNCKSYECETCFRTWDEKYDYNRHLKTHVKRHQCTRCPAKFRNKKLLDYHLTVHDCKKIFTCQYCQIVFKTKGYLYKHLLKQHKNEALKDKHEETKHLEELRLMSKQVLKCSRCPAIYKCIIEFDRHVKVHDSDIKFTCQYCQMVFRSKNNLNYHITKHHPDFQIMENERRLYSGPQLCPICGKYCQNTTNFNMHMKSHSTECMYQCDICSKEFKTKSKITAHIATHSKLRPFNCNYCSKTFRENYKRTLHERRQHLKVQPTVPCNVCSKLFHTNASLRAHMVTHTGEKRFECDICQKKFSFQASLKKHIETHSDERPYSCSYCPKTFKTTDYIKQHERLHTGERPVKCPVCLRGYAQICNMKSHFKYNHRELNYKQEMERYKKSLKELPK